MAKFKEFPVSVIEQLNYYVYLLIDPTNEEVFYVGKGTGNRIFSHLNSALSNPEPSDRLDKIRNIQQHGKDVKHIILRHGLVEKEAFEVEAAIIDYLGIKGLTNLKLGHDSRERGLMNAIDIIAQYSARRIEITEPSLLIRVNKLFRYGLDADELYEITRGNWVVGKRREKAKYAFSVYRGIVREVYIINNWFRVPARSEREKTRMRWRFDGEIADEMAHYFAGDVSHYISKRSQNPIKYLNC